MTGLVAGGIDTTGQPLSHLGFKAATAATYEAVRDRLLAHADGIMENVHNGRRVAKVALAEPLVLHDRPVSLVEVMPPKQGRPARQTGLEHVGFVVGPGLEDFVRDHRDAITERQDKGLSREPRWHSVAAVSHVTSLRSARRQTRSATRTAPRDASAATTSVHDTLTRQTLGPFCHPACVALPGGRRAKFYELGLRGVVEAEGHEFRRPP